MEKKATKNESNKQSASSSDSSQDSHCKIYVFKKTGKRSQPTRFQSLSGRIEKFSGRQGDADFELWVMDFNEATLNCGWDDVQRAKWFS